MITGLVVGAVGVTALAIRAADQGGPVPAAAAAPATASASIPTSAAAPVVSPTPQDPPSTPAAAAGDPIGSDPSTASSPSTAAGPSTQSGSSPESHPQRVQRGQPVAIKVPARGPATYKRAKLNLAAAKGHGRVVTFDVRIERNLKLDPKETAREIHATLSDRRSWRGVDHVRFRLVSDPAKARLHAYVVTPGTTDQLCYPWLTHGAVSCQNGNRVVLNAKRWVFGAKAYKKDVASYREYLVNHEFGHSLGYNHVGCPGKGRPAPVMMQQTKGLKGCRPNPWPSVADR